LLAGDTGDPETPIVPLQFLERILDEDILMLVETAFKTIHQACRILIPEKFPYSTGLQESAG
jgi:hypothetical protein